MEKHLIDFDSVIFYHRCHISHSHVFKSPLNKANISALSKELQPQLGYIYVMMIKNAYRLQASYF